MAVIKLRHMELSRGDVERHLSPRDDESRGEFGARVDNAHASAEAELELARAIARYDARLVELRAEVESLRAAAESGDADARQRKALAVQEIQVIEENKLGPLRRKALGARTASGMEAIEGMAGEEDRERNKKN
jgi:hypothetical protein